MVGYGRNLTTMDVCWGHPEPYVGLLPAYGEREDALHEG
mgnify:CR=1 FL=1